MAWLCVGAGELRLRRFLETWWRPVPIRLLPIRLLPMRPAPMQDATGDQRTRSLPQMRSRRRSRSRPLSRETTAASRSTGRVSGGCGALSRGTAGRGGSGSWGQPCRSTCPRTPLPRPKTSSACSAGRLRNVGRGAADASRGAPTGFFIGRVAKGLRSGSRPSQGPALTETGPHKDRMRSSNVSR